MSTRKPLSESKLREQIKSRGEFVKKYTKQFVDFILKYGELLENIGGRRFIRIEEFQGFSFYLVISFQEFHELTIVNSTEKFGGGRDQLLEVDGWHKSSSFYFHVRGMGNLKDIQSLLQKIKNKNLTRKLRELKKARIKESEDQIERRKRYDLERRARQLGIAV